MTESTAILSIHRLVCFALLWQGAEIFSLARSAALEIWSFDRLRPELERGLPLPSSLIAVVFADRSLKLVAILQMAVAAVGMIAPAWPLIVILFLTHLAICIRFRGVFNGGSDILMFVVLTGLLVAAIPHEKAASIGLIYIAVHTVYSYFRAGQAKLFRSEWRSGKALPAFLVQSLYPDIRRFAQWLGSRRVLCVIACWTVLLFELGIVFAPFLKGGIAFYFVTAMAFHFGVFVAFGLNRFFWAWLSAWPAILYLLA